MQLAPPPVDPDGLSARLRGQARNIRRHALCMGAAQGQGYIGQALGLADVAQFARRALEADGARLRDGITDYVAVQRRYLADRAAAG